MNRIEVPNLGADGWSTRANVALTKAATALGAAEEVESGRLDVEARILVEMEVRFPDDPGSGLSGGVFPTTLGVNSTRQVSVKRLEDDEVVGEVCYCADLTELRNAPGTGSSFLFRLSKFNEGSPASPLVEVWYHVRHNGRPGFRTISLPERQNGVPFGSVATLADALAAASTFAQVAVASMEIP